MSSVKISWTVLLLAVWLLGPFVGLARPQEEQGPVRTSLEPGQPVLAGVVSAFNIPARAVLCAADTGMGFIVVLASGGRRYAHAAEIIEQGCAGPWIITPQMISERGMTRRGPGGDVSSGYAEQEMNP